MKIAVEADSLVGSQAGIAKFNSNLFSEVLRVDQNNKYLFLSFGDPVRKKTLKFPIKWLWIPRKIYMWLFKKGIAPYYSFLVGKADIYVFPNFVRLPLKSGKSIVFVHDLTYLKYPETLEEKNLIYLRKFLPISVKNADHLVVISKSTKKDVIENFDVPEDKVTVIYPALPIEHAVGRDEDTITLKNRLGLGRYILFVGTLEPRKNIPRLIKAVEKLPQEYSDVQLVLVGKRAWKPDDIDAAIRESSLGDRIKELGYVADSDLPALYKGATLYAFPSLYEGFGIPVLEAFANEVPVVTSKVSSLPEVAGDAALMIDPTNVEEISSALLKLLENKDLRETLIRKGKIQVDKFSWQKSALDLIKVFEHTHSERTKG